VLDATVALVEEADLPEVADIADRTGLVAADVARALKAMDGVYVDLQMTMGDSVGWFVRVSRRKPGERWGSGLRRRA
jgi:hypothetical protein